MLDQDQLGGGTFVARISDAQEAPRRSKGNRKTVPAVSITYETSGDQMDVQMYEGAPGSIPSTSALGKLIVAFAALSNKLCFP